MGNFFHQKAFLLIEISVALVILTFSCLILVRFQRDAWLLTKSCLERMKVLERVIYDCETKSVYGS